MRRDNLLTPREVVAWLRVKPQTLNNWRRKGVGPPHLKLGDKQNSPVVYERNAVEEWLNGRERGYYVVKERDF